ncbi:MAG: GNAT family N-acetyltransferase [Aliidongia sp.]
MRALIGEMAEWARRQGATAAHLAVIAGNEPAERLYHGLGYRRILSLSLPGRHAMTILVTGSTGHLGEALMRMLRAAGRPARGLDIKPSISPTGSVRSPIEASSATAWRA